VPLTTYTSSRTVPGTAARTDVNRWQHDRGQLLTIEKVKTSKLRQSIGTTRSSDITNAEARRVASEYAVRVGVPVEKAKEVAFDREVFDDGFYDEVG
jgi:hypothetical protein